MTNNDIINNCVATLEKNYITNNYISVLKKYIEFDGCAKRPEFWWFVLINFVVSVLIGFISGTLSLVYSLVVLLPSLAVGARRLRDAGFSPLLLVLGLIPVVQLALIVLWIMPSKK